MATTKWMGLWAQERQGFYAGQVIKKSDIPANTRIVLRYNKFYEKDGNRPRFVYCFADAEGYADRCVSMEEGKNITSTVNELAETLREANNCPMMLPSESQERARMLMDKAIELVEELTGEEWRFEYLTFG